MQISLWPAIDANELLHCHPNAGSKIKLDNLVYEPPRDGPTLWEIGIPDRTAAEFYVPDANPKLVNRLFINHTDKFVLINSHCLLFQFQFQCQPHC